MLFCADDDDSEPCSSEAVWKICGKKCEELVGFFFIPSLK